MIPRAHLSPDEASDLDFRAEYSFTRRQRNALAGDCINENNRHTHGKATDGVRCRRCALVHKLGHAKAVETFEYHHAQVTP